MKREMKKKNDIEEAFNLTKCPKCGRYNYNGYVVKYGKCKVCKSVLDKKADFKYTMIRKLHLFKTKQAGHLYKRDAYSDEVTYWEN